MESPPPRVWGVLLVLAGLALLIALCGDAVGPRHLAAMRARAAGLEAKQEAAREVVRRAAELWPDDPERMWAESRSAQWLTAEEWAELLELRRRLGQAGAGPGPGAGHPDARVDAPSGTDERQRQPERSPPSGGNLLDRRRIDRDDQ